MFGIGGIELLLIAVFGFLIVGPEKLPQMAKTLAKALGKFRGAQVQMQKVIKDEIYKPEKESPLDSVTKVANKASSGATAEKTRAVSKAQGNTDVKSSGAGSTKQNDSTATKVTSAQQAQSFKERKAAYEKKKADQSTAQSIESSAQIEKKGE